MAKTPGEGERIEEQQAEEHRQSLQEAQSQRQAAEDDLKRVTMKHYFPELFLG